MLTGWPPGEPRGGTALVCQWSSKAAWLGLYWEQVLTHTCALSTDLAGLMAPSRFQLKPQNQVVSFLGHAAALASAPFQSAA